MNLSENMFISRITESNIYTIYTYVHIINSSNTSKTVEMRSINTLLTIYEHKGFRNDNSSNLVVEYWKEAIEKNKFAIGVFT